jgi:nitroreductase
MDIDTAIMERRSIRKFKPDEVPQETIREILEEAQWAPSWGNTQPWELYVVTGDVLKKFKEANMQKVMEGTVQRPDVPMPENWPDALKNRYRGIGKSVLSALSIGREDVEARNRYYAEMYGLFDAPCLILACVDKSICLEYAMLDVGLVMQTICLLAHEKGLGTCMLAAAVRHPELLRELLPIPEDKVLVIGAALGYPDLDSPVNQFERERATLDEFVTWVD